MRGTNKQRKRRAANLWASVGFIAGVPIGFEVVHLVNQSIFNPHGSTLKSGAVLVLVLLTMVVCGIVVGEIGKALTSASEEISPENSNDYRECPHCKEQMRRDAGVCPHCRRESEVALFGEKDESPREPYPGNTRTQVEGREIERATGSGPTAATAFRKCPHCARPMPRDASTCQGCGGDSPAWLLNDGIWWRQGEGGWYWLDEPNNAWVAWASAEGNAAVGVDRKTTSA